MSGNSAGPIVVGVDGSDAALHAVRWAAVEATHRRRELRLVHAIDDVSLSYPRPLPTREDLHGMLRMRGQRQGRFDEGDRNYHAEFAGRWPRDDRYGEMIHEVSSFPQAHSAGEIRRPVRISIGMRRRRPRAFGAQGWWCGSDRVTR